METASKLALPRKKRNQVEHLKSEYECGPASSLNLLLTWRLKSARFRPCLSYMS